MKSALYSSVAVSVLVTLLGASAAYARDTIQIAGSSTVLPFASIAAEEFGNAFPEYNIPVVGSGGSSGGLRQFCEGVGEGFIDIANASRAIKPAEIEACGAAGVKDIREIRIGYDGIVFAAAADKADFAFEPIHIYKALAALVPVNGELVANPYSTWDEIDPSLPAQAIAMAIPASNHGTREVFEDNVVLPGCESAELPAMDEDAMEAACLNFRQDVVTEIAGDYTETLARLQSDPNTIGVFGLSFYDQNRDRLKVATVSGVTPSLDSVASGEYPVSRPLFFYVKGEHIGVVPGIDDYVAFFMSEFIAGAGGILEEAGMIPAPEEEMAAVIAAYEAGETVGM